MPTRATPRSTASVRTPVRVGVLGLGAIAQTAHLPLLAAMRGVQVAALCDNDLGKARMLATRYGVRDVCEDVDELLDLPTLDAVIVCTPNHLHEVHVLSALRAGRHVLCERPVALQARGVERVLAAAAKAGRVLMVANTERFRADAQALDAVVRKGDLGAIRGVRAGVYRHRATLAPWRHRRDEAGGGALLELGLPLLDLAGWFTDFPRVERVAVTLQRGRGANAVEEAAVVLIECKGGFTVTLDLQSAYVGTEERWWFELLGSTGSARLAPLRVAREVRGRLVDASPSGAATRDSATVQSHRAALAHFVAAVRGQVVAEPPADQVRLHKLIDLIYASADRGTEWRG